MPAVLIGRKVGMTRVFGEDGRSIPVTVIEAGPCYVSQIKTPETDGYRAIQMAYEDVKPRNSTQQVIGHDAKAGLPAKRVHREVRLEDGQEAGVELGQALTVEVFDGIKFVDVTGTTKGHGFQGTMRRWGFKGMCASHGTERKHRSPGTLSGRSSNRGTGKPKKGIRMSGHWGVDKVTMRSLEVVRMDKGNNLLLVKGPVPGHKQALVMVREAVRLYKGKARVAKA